MFIFVLQLHLSLKARYDGLWNIRKFPYVLCESVLDAFCLLQVQSQLKDQWVMAVAIPMLSAIVLGKQQEKWLCRALQCQGGTTVKQSTWKTKIFVFKWSPSRNMIIVKGWVFQNGLLKGQGFNLARLRETACGSHNRACGNWHSWKFSWFHPLAKVQHRQALRLCFSSGPPKVLCADTVT